MRITLIKRIGGHIYFFLVARFWFKSQKCNELRIYNESR